VLSLAILLYIGPAIFVMIIILSVILLVIGIERIAIGIANPPGGRSRLVNIGSGLLIIAFSIILMQFPIFTSGVLIFLAAVALFLSGISRIVHGLKGNISGRSRALLLGVGTLSIAISILVMAHPIKVGLVLLGIMISIACLISGIEMMAIGIAGPRKSRVLNKPND
jgi:uncharacterized membrane protein HdeD (DUF308 family)